MKKAGRISKPGYECGSLQRVKKEFRDQIRIRRVQEEVQDQTINV